MDRPTYDRDARAWRAYQPHLPPDLRLDDDADLPAESWWAWRGHDVHLDRFAVPGAETTVILLHGGGGYGRLLAPFGLALQRRGHEVVLPDLPGYGLTRVPAGRVPRFADWIACAADLVQRERVDGRRVVLAGMSMGGMLAVQAASLAAPGAVDGVLATCLLDPSDPEVRRGAGRVALPAAVLRAPLADRVRVPVRLVAPVDRMSSLDAINRLCARDPQGGGRRVPLGFLRSWMTSAPPVEPEAFDRCPVVLAHPLADRWTPVSWSRRVLDRIAAPTRFVGLERCEHWPLESPGRDVLLEELERLAARRVDAGHEREQR
jgi:alpha-beta hydrolase superfamily lysophospholipase